MNKRLINPKQVFQTGKLEQVRQTVLKVKIQNV